MKPAPLTQWEVYGMLACCIEELERNGQLAIAMEREALDASTEPYMTDGSNAYGSFFRGFDSMADFLWAQRK